MSRNLIKRGNTLKIYRDGAARGNLGPAAYSFLVNALFNKFIALETYFSISCLV